MSDTEYSPEALCDLLTAGATAIGRPNVQAAVHLLTFTSLPHRRDFPSLIVFEYVDTDGVSAPAAFVRDWKALPASRAADRIGSGDARMLALAVGLATGEPVDLRENVAVGGHAHARRVIEAIAIATGYGEMFTVTPTPKLDELLAARDALTR